MADGTPNRKIKDKEKAKTQIERERKRERRQRAKPKLCSRHETGIVPKNKRESWVLFFSFSFFLSFGYDSSIKTRQITQLCNACSFGFEMIKKFKDCFKCLDQVDIFLIPISDKLGKHTIARNGELHCITKFTVLALSEG